MEKYYSILEKTKGRDKTCKFIQYITKLIIYKTGNKNLNSMENYLSMTRKILKLFNFISLYIIFMKYKRNPKKKFIDNIELLAALLDSISSIMDHLILLIKFNLLPENIKRYEDFLDDWSKKCWFLDILLERFIDFWSFNKMVPKKRINLYLKITENFFDTGVQFSNQKNIVIYCGILASFISLYLLFSN